MAIWGAVIAVSLLAGIAIAGPPDLGDEETPVLAAAPVTTTTSVPNATSTTEPPATTTTEAPPEARPAARVVVLVANGTDVSGGGSRFTRVVADLGWPTLPAVDGVPVESTQIWFMESYEPEARVLAGTLGLPEDRLLPVPFPSPIPPGDANLIVVLGPDLAS